MSNRDEWARRVEAWEASGKSVREFCEGRDFSAKNLTWWAWHFRRGKKPPAASKRVSFARVVRQRDAASLGAALVVHVGGACIEVGPGADRATLATVLDALGAPRAGGRS